MTDWAVLQQHRVGSFAMLSRMTRTQAPTDSSDLRLEKRISIGVICVATVALVLWGALYTWLGEPRAGTLFFVWAAFSVATLALLAIGLLNFNLFMLASISGLLGFSFLITLLLGGLLNSGGHMAWGLLAPLAPLLRNRPREAMVWFVAFVTLVALLVLQPASTNLASPFAPLFLAMNVVGVSSMAIGALYYFLEQRNLAYSLLRREQERSENLLLNILPSEIADRLKHSGDTIADYYPSASVLYADLVGFTPLTAKLAPKEMVDLLNDIFSHFDALVERYGVEKIRTIGDNYMVAAGLPQSRPDHAHLLAGMALDICAFIESWAGRLATPINFRIGINSGPLIAGVIGRRKFQYDLWGDTVNVASRMESQGTPGKIQITEATYELIKDEFVCERRGTLTVKGKGEMETWYLVGRRF